MSHRRLHAPWLAAALALACGACGPSSAPGPARTGRVPDGSMHMLLLNGLQGLAEGVPCNPLDLPPLACAAEARDKLVAQGEPAALLLVGDTLSGARGGQHNKTIDAARQARAFIVLDAIGAAKPAAWTPGPGDLLEGRMEPVLKRSAELGIPVLLSNVAAPTHPEIRPWIVLTGGTLRIGLLGVLPARIVDADAVKSGDKDVDDRLKDVDLPGATVLPPRDTIQRLAAQLRQEQDVDFVILLSGLSGKGNNGMLDAGLDVILGSTEVKAGTDSVLFTPQNVMLATALQGGGQVGHTLLRVVGGSLSGIRNLSLLHTLPAEIAREDAALRDLVEHYGTSDIDRLAHLASPGDETTFKDRIQLLQENKDVIVELGKWKGSAIDHSTEPLAPVAAGNPVQAALAGLGPAVVQALASPELGPVPAPEGTPTIPVSSACEGCHASQVAFWRSTPHANSVETLVARQRQHDPTCLKCHAAGFDDPLGWKDPRLDAPLGPVGCWSCHRTVRQHADKPRQAVDPSVAGLSTSLAMNCENCHQDRRSPGFDRDQVLASVSCPPMHDDEPTIVLARQAALDQIATRRSKGLAEPRDDYLEARALIGLGREEGWTQLDRVAAASSAAVPPDNALVYEIAQFADRRGRSAHAIELVRTVLAHQQADPVANWVHADLLLHANDPSVRNPAAAAQQLGLILPPDATNSPQENLDLRCLQVEALIDCNRIDEARDLLFVLTRDHPHDSRLTEQQKRVNGR